MGYTTSFEGVFKFSRELTLSEYHLLEDLADYDSDASSKAMSKLASTHPDAYDQWQPTRDGWGLEWNGAEKFYEYVAWLEWLVKYFFEPRDIVVNGTLTYQGEEIGDVGQLEVSDNVVKQIKLDVEGILECPNCGHRFKSGG